MAMGRWNLQRIRLLLLWRFFFLLVLLLRSRQAMLGSAERIEKAAAAARERDLSIFCAFILMANNGVLCIG